MRTSGEIGGLALNKAFAIVIVPALRLPRAAIATALPQRFTRSVMLDKNEINK